MSRTTAHATSSRRLPIGLLRGLIDDAAVFPPGCADLPDAVADYRRRQRAPLADYIGPLLVPVSMAAELATLVTTGVHDGEALPVALIARPGVDPGALGAALEVLGGQHRLGGRPGLGGGLSVVGVELAHQEGWRAAVPDLPAAVEVPRGPAGHAALTDLARPDAAAGRDARAGASDAARAKLRTQATATDPVPTAEELADFIGTCVRLGLGFKLTGGLHHAVAHSAAIDPGTPSDTGSGTEEQHGVLNVMLATHLALTGTDHEHLVEALGVRDAEAVAGPLLDLTGEQVAALRTRFTSFGCCGVTDPLTDLTSLELVDLP